MTDDERAAIRAAAHAAAATAPPLTGAQRDHLNDLFRDAMRTVVRDFEEEDRA